MPKVDLNCEMPELIEEGTKDKNKRVHTLFDFVELWNELPTASRYPQTSSTTVA